MEWITPMMGEKVGKWAKSTHSWQKGGRKQANITHSWQKGG
jgi:hypothetical protein